MAGGKIRLPAPKNMANRARPRTIEFLTVLLGFMAGELLLAGVGGWQRLVKCSPAMLAKNAARGPRCGRAARGTTECPRSAGEQPRAPARGRLRRVPCWRIARTPSCLITGLAGNRGCPVGESRHLLRWRVARSTTLPRLWPGKGCSKRGRHGGRPPGVRTTRVTRALLLPLEDELALGALPILAAQARAVAKADRGDLLGTCLCTGDIDWIDCCASSSRPPASMCARCSIRMCRWRSRTPARALVGSPRLQPRTRAPGVATPQGRPPCPRTGG